MVLSHIAPTDLASSTTVHDENEYWSSDATCVIRQHGSRTAVTALSNAPSANADPTGFLGKRHNGDLGFIETIETRREVNSRSAMGHACSWSRAVSGATVANI